MKPSAPQLANVTHSAPAIPFGNVSKLIMLPESELPKGKMLRPMVKATINVTVYGAGRDHKYNVCK